MQIQLIAIYAYTSSHPDATTYNSSLLHAALDASTYVPLPTIILCDFNGNPFRWDTKHRLNSLGFSDLPAQYSLKYNQTMPPTCKRM